MKFKDFELQRFRGIESIEFSDFRDINLIVGKNNSSKTSILEALFILSGSLTPEILLRINLFRSLRFVEQDDFRLIFNSLNYKKNIFIKARGFLEDSRTLEIIPSVRNAKTHNVSKNVSREYEESDLNSYTGGTNINELTLQTTVKERHTQEKKDFAKIFFQNPDFITENGTGKIKNEQRAVYVTQNLNLSSNLEKELEDLIITKNHLDLVEVLRTVDISIDNIMLGHNRMIYVDTGMERLIPVNLLGDGIRRLLSVILAIYNARGGIVLIDEIDNGLHFSTLKSLWKSVVTTAKKCNVQVFVTTHNHETIKYLSESLQEPDFEYFQSKVKTYTVRKLKNGEHKSYGYDFEQFSNAINDDIELR
jgi:AAA15 family ATPase/GTPase